MDLFKKIVKENALGLFLSGLAILCILAFFELLECNIISRNLLNEYYVMLLFAEIGIIFHICYKYQEIIKAGKEFKFKDYKWDYAFRIFQAAVYSFIIRLYMDEPVGANGDDPTTTELAAFVLLSFLIGVYIRTTEKVFIALKNKFSKLLSGIFGASLNSLDKISEENFITVQNRVLKIIAYLEKETNDQTKAIKTEYLKEVGELQALIREKNFEEIQTKLGCVDNCFL